MSNKQGVRLGWVHFLVVCLIAAAGVAVLKGVNQPRVIPNINTRDELVTFVVTFKPNPRSRAVSMLLTAGTKSFTPQADIKSPMVREEMLPPGTAFSLVAEQWEDGRLTCKVRKGLKVIVPEQPRDTKGVLACIGIT